LMRKVRGFGFGIDVKDRRLKLSDKRLDTFDE